MEYTPFLSINRIILCCIRNILRIFRAFPEYDPKMSGDSGV